MNKTIKNFTKVGLLSLLLSVLVGGSTAYARTNEREMHHDRDRVSTSSHHDQDDNDDNDMNDQEMHHDAMHHELEHGQHHRDR